jgi:outer membrane assembly lipoprotein YfgL
MVSCTSVKRPEPKEVTLGEKRVAVSKGWSASVAPIKAYLTPYANASLLVLASENGRVQALSIESGQPLWSLDLKTPLNAGVGGNGEHFAVITQDNQLVVFTAKGELYRTPLLAQGLTTPLVAGGRVFTLLADRSVAAYDLIKGNKLWSQQRAGDPLILNQKGVLLAVHDTLIAGFSGRLVGMNPNTGAAKFETPIAVPRGVNDLERLVDLVAPAYRFGDVVCVRAFQAQVGCVNAVRGNLLWTRSANGDLGLSGNADVLIGVESNGVVLAWARTSGERVWDSDRLKYRRLSAPLITDKGLVLADSVGDVFVMDLKDGAVVQRLTLAQGGLVGGPIAHGKGFVVVTQKGWVQSYQFD